MKKIVALLILAVMLCGCVLTSCSGGTEQEGSQSHAVPEGNVTVVFYHTMGKNLRDVLVKYIAEFNKIYPNITIDEQSIGGYDDVRDQVMTELQAGKQPAITYCYPDHVATYLRSKKVIDINEYINDPEVGLTEAQISDFIAGYYAEGKQFGDESKMYTLPFSKSTEVMYYNKTFFDQNGLQIPDHWFASGDNDVTSLEYVIKKIKEIDPNSIPLGYDSEANWFITMTEQLKTPYTQAVDKVEDRFIFNDAKNREFCDKFRSWFLEGLLTTQALYGGYTSGLFTNDKPNESGNVSKSYISIGSSAGATYQCPAKSDDGTYPFEVGIATIPQADASNKKVISQGPSICMLKQKNNDVNNAAWAFIKFLLTSTEFQAEFSMTSGYVPVLKSTFELEAYKEFLNGANNTKEGIAALSAKVCMDQENFYFTSPAFVGSSVARDQVGNIMTYYISATENTSEAELLKIFEDAYKRCVAYSK
ncbi:MAG: extracellular solute-binding protein [Clostridia bacterium]|nr:extracellular solute-binding protein [Clostridia bacterium]